MGIDEKIKTTPILERNKLRRNSKLHSLLQNRSGVPSSKTKIETEDDSVYRDVSQYKQ